MSAPVSVPLLLYSPGPVSVCTRTDAGHAEARHAVRCPCGRDTDWLIVADTRHVTFVCRCGQRRDHPGLELTNVVALVEAAPTQPAWSGVENAIEALGFAPQARHTHTRARPERS